jgi:hypothetical protein
MRAYQGLIQYLKALDAPVNWQEAYRSLSMPVTPEQPLTVEPARPSLARSVLSHALKIRVLQDGRTKAEVTLPSTATENLSDLLPPGLDEKLADRGIDVSRIAQETVSGGFAPGDLFHFEEGAKSYRVWLE